MMWTTKIKAICPESGKLTLYSGPVIDAPSRALAQEYCQNNGLGYCKIEDRLLKHIPQKDGKPDWDNEINYETYLN